MTPSYRKHDRDDNQPEIVMALRHIGASVQFLDAVGGGVPDLLVGYKGKNYLLEVKDGKKAPSRRKLRPIQQEWHSTWKGQVCVVISIEEAIAVVREDGSWFS